MPPGVENYTYLLVIAAVDALFGIFVLARNPGHIVNRVFAVFNLSIAAWIGSVAHVLTTQTLRLNDLLFFSGFLVVGSLFLLSYVFPNGERVPRRLAFAFLPLLVLMLGIPFDIYVSDIRVTATGMATPVNGPGMPLFAVIAAGYLLASIAMLARSYRSARGRERMQLQYLALGGIIFMASAVLFDVVLPALGIPELNNLGPIASLAFVASTAYAIVRYQLLDIRVVIQRGMIYGAFIAVVLLLYLAGLLLIGRMLDEHLAEPLAAAAAAVAVVLTYQPLDALLRRITDNLLFKDHYDTAEALRMTGELLVTAMAQKDVFHRLALLMQKIVKADSVHVLACREGKLQVLGAEHEDTHHRELYAVLKEYTVDCASGVFHDGGPDQRIRFTEIVEREKTEPGNVQMLMEKGRLALLVPVMVREHFVGLLALGPKRSGERYSPNDLHYLRTASHQIAFAIENADLYEKQRQYAESLEAEVQKRTEEIVKLHDRQMQLVQDLSHGLQTPIAIMQNQIEAAKGEGVSVSGLKQLTERMTLIIRRILRLAMGEEAMTREPRLLNLCPLLHDLAEQISVITEDKGVTFESDFQCRGDGDRGPGVNVVGDAVALRDVFSELLANALKHTDAGGSVTLTAKRDAHKIVVRVHDTGSGISEDDLGHVFDRFFRADEETGQGTGLGLSIVKSIVEAHGGTITAESVEGEGSTFTVTLPIAEEGKKKKG